MWMEKIIYKMVMSKFLYNSRDYYIEDFCKWVISKESLKLKEKYF